MRATLALTLLFLAPLSVLPAAARAELTQRGNLFLSFEGGISPGALPREQAAPIAVEVAGRIRTLSGERPPALREIRIELNRAGHLNTEGLPLCREEQLAASTARQALSACGEALVGTGTYEAATSFPEQDAFPADGRILAFNARQEGKTAILAHVYGTSPAPMTRVIAFTVSRPRKGPYGTVLHGELPASINRWGYLKRIALRLHRTYRHRGRTRSYVSAACEAPPGFPGASFRFAKAWMGFADGRTLTSTLTRSCAVRGSYELSG